MQLVSTTTTKELFVSRSEIHWNFTRAFILRSSFVVQHIDSQNMKYFIAVLALSVFGQDGLAFSVQKGNAFRSSSSLYMAVEEKEQKMVKVGVIGCGRIGLVHLEAITKAPGVTPVIVSNPTVSKAEAGEICLDLFFCWHLLRSVI